MVDEWTGASTATAVERAPTDRIQVTARFPSIPPASLGEFKALAARALEITQGESGVLQYDWFFDEDGSACVVR